MKRNTEFHASIHPQRCEGNKRLSRLLFLILLVLPFLPAQGAPANTSVAIVVNPQTPVDDLTLAEVRKVFLGERQYWPSNMRVVLLVRAPVARERDIVLRIIYRMSESQFRQYWIAKIFRAEITAGPKIVLSTEMTKELIAAIPGAIASTMADKVAPGMKILRIDGKLPGENGYPLQ
ncbi:MAG: type 2 periplasmic-binding domain-containing protein [Terriglobia bacterium]